MAFPGTTHKYSKRRIAFEHASPNPSNDAPNTMLWVGGLTDGLLTVPYPAEIAKSLPLDWVLAEVLIKSSYIGWGTSSLAHDARELGDCVAYFKKLRPGKKVVVMGHSTGCQDIMEYLVGEGKDKRERLDGIILQGGVSDREAWEDFGKEGEAKKALQDAISTAKELIDAGREKEFLSPEGNVVLKEMGGPLNAYRAYSLLAKGGDDDYFSSDLPDEYFAKTFGKIPRNTPVCFLLGSEDPYVPASVDRAALLQRWTRIIRESGGIVDDEDGGVIPGAHHNLDEDPEPVVQDLVKRVCGFVIGLGSNFYADTCMMPTGPGPYSLQLYTGQWFGLQDTAKALPTFSSRPKARVTKASLEDGYWKHYGFVTRHYSYPPAITLAPVLPGLSDAASGERGRKLTKQSKGPTTTLIVVIQMILETMVTSRLSQRPRKRIGDIVPYRYSNDHKPKGSTCEKQWALDRYRITKNYGSKVEKPRQLVVSF